MTPLEWTLWGIGMVCLFGGVPASLWWLDA